jgi:hypothetical protein
VNLRRRDVLAGGSALALLPGMQGFAAQWPQANALALLHAPAEPTWPGRGPRVDTSQDAWLSVVSAPGVGRVDALEVALRHPDLTDLEHILWSWRAGPAQTAPAALRVVLPRDARGQVSLRATAQTGGETHETFFTLGPRRPALREGLYGLTLRGAGRDPLLWLAVDAGPQTNT